MRLDTRERTNMGYVLWLGNTTLDTISLYCEKG
jgi:hypothetical protein